MSELISRRRVESVRLQVELTLIIADAAHIMTMIVIIWWAVVGAILRSCRYCARRVLVWDDLRFLEMV